MHWMTTQEIWMWSEKAFSCFQGTSESFLCRKIKPVWKWASFSMSDPAYPWGWVLISKSTCRSFHGAFASPPTPFIWKWREQNGRCYVEEGDKDSCRLTLWVHVRWVIGLAFPPALASEWLQIGAIPEALNVPRDFFWVVLDWQPTLFAFTHIKMTHRSLQQPLSLNFVSENLKGLLWAILRPTKAYRIGCKSSAT